MTRRADAVRNRARLLQAAHEVFLNEGITAPLDHIRQVAGVGRATLYRNFPDRGALVEALLERSFRRIETLVEGRQDPHAFFDLLSATVSEIADNCTLYDFWRAQTAEPQAVERLQERLMRCFEPPIGAAKGAGLLREDMTAADMALGLRMIGSMLSGQPPEDRPAQAWRAVHLIIHGMITPEGAEQVGPCPQPGVLMQNGDAQKDAPAA
ncbi:TetR/AcrR family transcriptional regulator [Pseudooceanicola nanhaiensis]|uniref:TetR/AcrR family transcriptional regulator n=1 Tax=Pseudooceanicola nanhaiensis TaxID=375761 RepID=UPI001CD4E1D4|nr:TetR/AcrR family transcriptional regulator [Pseudooceanicola nanhaiensis]MCA0922233.1 TetR/AcrR family transcriptional regulator [Pseudooceanicola nanhaiensis]